MHVAAALADYDKVVELLDGETDSDLVHIRDDNGWQAIHEAARAGSVPILQFLIQSGADLNARTKSGGSVLWWAKETLEPDHEAIQFLESMGAV